MKRPIIYLAHPLGGDVAGNVRNALRWLAFAMACQPTWTVIAPWLAAVASGADDDNAQARERGLLVAVAIIERCDGILLCGGRISGGMQRELDAAIRCGLRVFDYTPHGPVAPPVVLASPLQRLSWFAPDGDAL